MSNPYAVRLGDWQASGAGYLDANGNRWYLSPIEGWRSSGPRDAEFEPRGRQDGGYDDRTFARPRVIVVKGKLRSPSAAARDAAADELIATLGEGQSGQLLVTEAHMTRWCDVRVSDETICDPINARTSIFSVQLTAADPRRFSEQPQYAETGLRTTGTGGLSFGGDSVIEHNLSTNPYLAVNATGWDAQPSSSLSSEARGAVTGFARGFAYRSVVGTAGYALLLAPAVPVTPGFPYRFLDWVRSSRAQLVEMRVQWQDSLGVEIATTGASAVALAANTPTAVEVFGDAPVNAAFAQPFAAFLSTQVSDALDHTQSIASQSSTPLTYFDGGSANSVWDGTAGVSTSTRTTGVSGLDFPLDFGTAGEPGQMTLLNAGNVTVSPVFTVYGPVLPFDLVAVTSGGTLSYGLELADADYLVIDVYNKTILLNGMVTRYADMTSREFSAFDLAPGAALKVGFQSHADENSSAKAEAMWFHGYR